MDTATHWGMIGHGWAVEMLARRLRSERSAHAYLITGPGGVGKTTLAIRFAQALTCTGESPPCRACRACTHIERNIHPDVTLLEPDSGRIKIEPIRDLTASLSLPPMETRYRVAILSDMGTATDQANDALLKTLEEPPRYVRLLLTSELSESLLPTLVSRCQLIPLRPVPVGEIEAALKRLTGLGPAQAALVARLSGGRPGWALTAAADEGFLDRRDDLLNGMLGALAGDRVARFAYAEAAASDGTAEVLDALQTWWRDVLLRAEGSTVEPVNADRLAQIDEMAAQTGPAGARSALRAVRETARIIQDTNVNTRLALEVMMLDLPYLA